MPGNFRGPQPGAYQIGGVSTRSVVIWQPFILDASASMIGAMKTSEDSWPDDEAKALSTLPAGHAFTVPQATFRKITDQEREDWQLCGQNGRFDCLVHTR